MSLATALLTPILGDASPWTPRRLFQLGEAGGVYDPSDLTAEKVAWRRNLYLYSEPASATGYTTNNVTFGTIAQFSFLPSGGNGVTLADSTVSRSLTQSFTLTAGITYTLSFYVYVGAGVLPNQGSGTYRDFTITRNNDDVTNYALINYEAVGGGVYRVTHSWLHTGLNPTVVVRKYGGLSTATRVDFSGLQLEVGTTASAYQRITDFTSDFLAAFPTHALYQDAAGTTPVTALGQPVGLVIDSKTGGLANVGPELVTNGDFSSGTGWTLGTGWSISGGSANASGATSGSAVKQSLVLQQNKFYRITYTISAYTSGQVSFAAIDGFGTAVNLGIARSAVGTYTEYFTAAAGVVEVGIIRRIVDFTGSIDNISVRLVPGTHAIQPTNSSRPLLDGRVNLLTRTEEFNDAAWSKLGASVTANSAVAPDGTSTADALVEDTSTGTHQVRQDFTTAAVPYAFSVYAKASGRSWLLLYNTTAGYGRAFNVTTGQLGTASIGTSTGTVENVGNGWYRCTLTGTPTAASNAFRIYANTADDMNASYTGTGISSVLLWGADLRLATDAAYPYQRVAAATDYTDVGVPRAFAFDGFDDSLYTASNMDLSGTDKVTVLAGVRKLSDAAAGTMTELSGDPNSTNGSFSLLAPSSAAANYSSASRGTIQRAATATGFAAPTTNIFGMVADISGDFVATRINGSALATSTGDQGTGNYSSAVLFIGRRNNASLPFNGKAYQLIVRGALTDAATLAQAERYVGAKTGIFL